MENNRLVEKLAFQVESFQEGFEILSKSKDFKEMTKTFAHLLRGNFSLKDVFLLHKKSPDTGWEPAGLGNAPDNSDLVFFEDCTNIKISYYHNNKINASVILPLINNSYLGILLGKKIDATAFSDFDKITLQILLQVFDSAYKSFINQQNEKKLIFELNEKVFQLSNLIDTGIELSKLEKRNILYNLALERACSITNASAAILRITLPDKIDEEYFTFPGQIEPEVILNNKFRSEFGFVFKNYKYDFILAEKETRGGVTSFTNLDKMLHEAITRQLQASIENEFLHLQTLEKERIEKELNLAAAIQQQIIPKELPGIPGYEMAGINIPSKEVGGDYFDCIKLKDEKYIFIIADVAGKGISAALLVNTLNAAIYSYLEFDLPLSLMVEKLNKLIYKATPSDKYITFFIALLDPESGSVQAVNAGHNPILLLRNNGTLEKINAGGLGLGMLDFGLPYPGENLILDSGDKLFLYTDGIPEAMNTREEEYSDERMIEFFKNKSLLSTKEFTSAIVNDIRTHTRGADQSDDITLLLLKKI